MTIRRGYYLTIIIICLFQCASMKNLDPEIPSNLEGRFIITEDDTSIFIYDYIPKQKNLGIIYIISGITGINHFQEKDMILALSQDKYQVSLIHPRGTGFSGGPRGNLKDFSLILKDYMYIIQNHRLSNQLPLFLYATVKVKCSSG